MASSSGCGPLPTALLFLPTTRLEDASPFYTIIGTRPLSLPKKRGLAFSLADIKHAFATAEAHLGSPGPFGKSWNDFWKLLRDTDEWTVYWGVTKGKTPSTMKMKKGSRTAMPKNASRGVKNLLSKQGNRLYHFEAGIIHELIHAYQQWKGMEDKDPRQLEF